MTEVQIGQLIEEAERRKGIKADINLIWENAECLTVDLYMGDRNSVIKETLSVPHIDTAEQREDFIEKVGEKLEALSLRAK